MTQLSVVAERAGVHVWAPEPGNGVGDPVAVARSGVEQARANGYASSSWTPPAASVWTPR